MTPARKTSTGLDARVVAQVGAALVVEARPGDLDPDPEHVAALVGARGRPCRSSHVSGPSNGTLRPNSSFEWRLGVKLTTNGPISYAAPRLDDRRRPAVQRISRASESQPYTVAPSRRAIAGASTAWSQWVWPIRIASARAHVAVDQRRVRQRRPAQDELSNGTRETYGSTSTVVPSYVSRYPATPSHSSSSPAGQPERHPLELAQRCQVIAHGVDTLRTRQTASRAV